MTAKPEIAVGTALESAPCPDCGGRLILRETPEQWRRGRGRQVIWLCEHRPTGCRGLCGAHPNGEPTGHPADQATRKARSKLHDEMLDPLWRRAVALYNIKETEEVARNDAEQRIRAKARVRVCSFLGWVLGMEAPHVGDMDIDTCRRAWVALKGVTYGEIRNWAKEKEKDDG